MLRVPHGQTPLDPIDFLWDAVVQFDDAELGEWLFWLFAHHPMRGLWASRAIRIFRLSELSDNFLKLLRRLLGLAVIPTNNSSGKNVTWDEFFWRHPTVIRRLRHYYRNGGWASPFESEIAWALGVLLKDAAAGVASPDDGRTAGDHELLQKLHYFREMANLWPRNIVPDQAPQWVEMLQAADCRQRFTARLVLRTIGVSAIPALEQCKAQSPAEGLIYRILSDNQRRILAPGDWLCVACFHRLTSFTYNSKWRRDSDTQWQIAKKEHACRNCRSTAYAIRAPRVICVLDRSLAADRENSILSVGGRTAGDTRKLVDRLRSVTQEKSLIFSTAPWATPSATPSATPTAAPSTAPTAAMTEPASLPEHHDAKTDPVIMCDLAVNWAAVRRPFDFNALYIGDVDEEELERLLIVLNNAKQGYKQLLQGHIPIYIERPGQLSDNARTLLWRHFSRAEYPSKNPDWIHSVRSAIATYVDYSATGPRKNPEFSGGV
jgi:hypothetical protein